MAKKRDTVLYDLLGPKGQILYIGTTNDPERREDEHRDEGLRFRTLHVRSRRMTEPGAKEKEERALDTYQGGHQGRNPRYNKDPEG